jgi:hypothetical protein
MSRSISVNGTTVRELVNARDASISVETQPDTSTRDRISSHRAVLKQFAIDDLWPLGSLELSGNVLVEAGVAVPGLPSPGQTSFQHAYRYGRNGYELIAAGAGEVIGTKNIDVVVTIPPEPPDPDTIPNGGDNLNDETGVGPILRIPRPPTERPRTLTHKLLVDVAYWAADRIVIRDDTNVVVMEPNVSLVIVCNELVIGQNVTFTWQQPTLQIGRAGNTPAKPGPAPSSTSVSAGTTGFAGGPGRPGGPGANGLDAPSLEIWTLAMEGGPATALNGETATAGGPGGDGGVGGDGAVGTASRSGGGGLWCNAGPGNGGDGGRGGNGGTGGKGGHGGAGGTFRLYAPANVVTSFTGSGFYIGVDGGQGGGGGRGGGGGAGGNGGAMGTVSRGCTTGGRRAGATGPPGAAGPDGEVGSAGDHGRILLVVNDELPVIEFAILNVVPQSAGVDDPLTANGIGFAQGDVVEVAGTPAATSFLQAQTLTFTLPAVAGGVQSVRVRRADGTRSNAAGVYVVPRIASMTPDRVRPGDRVSVEGSGFAMGSLVEMNGGTTPADAEDMPDVVVRSPTELTFTAQRPTRVTPNPAGEIVAVRVLTPDHTAGSDAGQLVLETFQMLVVGDSVQWGQGLLAQDKVHTRVANDIAARVGNVGVYELFLPHSGAVLEAPGSGPVLDGEVPTSFPTVTQQVQAASATPAFAAPEDVDLVLVDGGANDVDIRVILDVTADDDALRTLVENACRVRMEDVLNLVARSFTNAHVIVLGYYPIVSDQSDVTLITLLIAALGGVLGGLLGTVAKARAVQRCAIFASDANANLGRAVDALNASNPLDGQARAFLAVPAFGPENAVFAPNPFVWGLDADGSPQDPIAGAREMACRVITDTIGRQECDRASAGHPNVRGAEAYANAIRPVLSRFL